MVRQKADFFGQLAIHGSLGAFAGLDAALRKLPGMLLHAFAPEHFVALVGDDDADIGAITFSVQHNIFRPI